MKKTRLITVAAALAVGSLALTGCGGSNGGENDAVVIGNGTEPENPLIPTATNEVGGGKILDMVFAGLIYYDDKGETKNEIAESITTTDSQNFNIKIKSGLKFSDGSPVKAENFVKAWNDGAKPSNGRLSGSFFEPIEGYVTPPEDMKPGDKSLDKPLSGLKVVDETTFTVKLAAPTADFPERLGYSAFVPLPDAAFDKDGNVTKEFGNAPIGYGPYMLKDDKAWVHNESISLIPNPEYQGDRKPKNGGVELKFYAKQEAAYAELLSDQLDVLDQVPDQNFGTYEKELAGRAVNQPAALFQSFAIPNVDHFKYGTEEGNLRRQALSLAINREEITDKIFLKTRTPAKDFSTPVIPGYTDKLQGAEVLKNDPAKAKELWAKADGISKFTGQFKLAYNADGGHQAWADAVCNQLKNTLGIDAVGQPYPDFKSFRADINAGKMTSGFRTGWQADYPSLYNYLGPLYQTGGGSNDTKYSNPEFDKLMAEGNKAKTIEEANGFFQKGQEILLKDLPVIPLWYANTNGGWSAKVKDVTFNWQGVPQFYKVVKEG